MAGTSETKRIKQFAPAGLIFSVLGLLLFAYFVKKTGVAEILEGIKRLGVSGFLLVLLASAIRPAVRALCWMRCVRPPYHLRFGQALKSFLAADSLGNILPMGLVASEPAKAALIRDRIPLSPGFSSVVLENIFYGFSVLFFLLAGTAALLLSFQLPDKLRLTGYFILGGLVLTILIAYMVISIQFRFLTRTVDLLLHRKIAARWLTPWRARVAEFEDRIYGFSGHSPLRFLSMLLLEMGFHLGGILEIYVMLLFISPRPPSWLAAFLLESVNRVINVVFKFVPFRVGVDEVGTSLFTSVLKMGPVIGVAMAVIRKARVLFWSAIGVALLIQRGFSIRSFSPNQPEFVSKVAVPAKE